MAIKKSKLKIGISAALFVTIVSGVVGTIAWFDNRYALAGEQKKTDQEIKQDVKLNKVNIQINQTQQTVQQSLDNYYFQKKKKKQYPSDDEIADEYQKASDEVKNLKEQVKQLKRKKFELEDGN